ncbi:antibiotic biosynthesis monooxygenase [Streptomyces alkaliphilus]|uniref:antibiotic biosynthesis monooxygenase n=1 Tax=Streptomyces alkaliphilus TaxID=1472722 RepID=UPI0034D31F8C
MSAGLRVLLRIDVVEGREAEFEELWRTHAKHVHTLPDNHGQQLLRSRGERGRYVVLTDWTDEPTFRAFERSEEQQAYLRRLWPLRADGEMRLLEPMDEMTPAVSAATQSLEDR